MREEAREGKAKIVVLPASTHHYLVCTILYDKE